MLLESPARHAHGFLELACSTVLLGQLSEGDRRRVAFDPTSQVVDAWIVPHARIVLLGYGTTVTVVVVLALRPSPSVIVSRTVYVPVAAYPAAFVTIGVVVVSSALPSPKFQV